MNVKRYFVKDMQEAMEKIRKELGSDAIVLSSKPVRKKGLGGLFSAKVLEVMVAYDTEPQRKLPKAQPDGKVQPAIPAPEMASLRAAAGLTQAAQQYKGEAAAKQAPNKAQPLDGAPIQFSAEMIESLYAHAHPAEEQSAQSPQEGQDDVAAKLDNMGRMLENLAGRVNELQYGKTSFTPEVHDLYVRLLGQEVCEEVAATLADQTQKTMEKSGVGAQKVMNELIQQCLGEAAPLRIKPFKRSVVIMLGPTGVGKTTSLIKLAVYYQTKYDLKVGLINTDTYRVAANEQLKIYADILGAPMSVIYSPDELGKALAEHEDKDLVFIDTAGKRPTDERHKKEIEEYIALSGADEIYLVMSASTGFKACERIIENYDFVKDYKLLVTKMDEAATRGILLNVCNLAGRPLSYIATGQNVPNDIALADPQQIAKEILAIE